MLFKDKIIKAKEELEPEVVRIIQLAWENQSHKSDLLIWLLNGFYDPSVINFSTPEKKLSPYVFGPSNEGWSEDTHYQFIQIYRDQLNEMPYEEYKKLHIWSIDRQIEINELCKREAITVQLEMLVYLKFWEADMIIKKLYQLTRILHGEHYDWHFRIQESSRDKSATGKRHDIIRELRDRLEKISFPIYSLIKKCYKTQYRNSIAHSNYSIHSRYIHLNNFIAGDQHSQENSISFDHWVDIFSKTIIIHSEYIHMKNLVRKLYEELALSGTREIGLRITEENGRQYEAPVCFREGYNDWVWKTSIS